MSQKKSYTAGTLQEYIASEVSHISKERKDKKKWRKNEEFHSQVTIREVKKEKE